MGEPGPAAAPIASVPVPAPPGTRPRVGLVLSGGGARGMTHIGVLKVLDEMRVPVDYIAATSMGSIVGGLYSIGMTPARMQEVVTTVNWTSLFSDAPPRVEAGFRDKERDTRFPLPLEIGFRDGQIRGFQGALSGANLGLFLRELTNSAEGIRDFNRLPVPFRAVSTDMVTGKPYVFTEGPLYEAMRASMSIPGVFSPIEVRGHLLGDGGLVDNLPVDVVRDMGAQVVIAVNIGTPLMSRAQLSSIVGLTGQMINILTEQNVRLQLATLRPGDVLVSPDLGALSAVDFKLAGDFIKRGEEAVRQIAPRLAEFSLSPAAYAAYKAAQPRIADTPPPRVEFVRVEGTQYANPKALEAALDVPLDAPLDTRSLDAGISRLYGSGEYERIDYALVDQQNRTGLVINVQEKSIGPNYLRFGLAYSTDFQGENSFSVLAGHRRVWVNSLGAEWSNEVELGRVARAGTEFYQPLDVERNLFVSAQASAENVPRYIFNGDQRVAEYRVQANSAGVDFGLPIGNSGQLRIGPTYTYYKGVPTIAIAGFDVARQTDAGVRLLARWDNLDNAYFPRSGVKARADVFYGQRTQQLGSFAPQISNRLGRGEVVANMGIPLTENGFLNVAARAGALNRDDPSLVNPFLAGGLLDLSGLRTGQLSGSYVGLGRAVYYYRLATVPYIGGSFYAGGSVEAGNTWQQRAMVGTDNLVKAGSVFLAADTFLGPLYFAYGRASGGASSFYLFLGNPR